MDCGKRSITLPIPLACIIYGSIAGTQVKGINRNVANAYTRTLGQARVAPESGGTVLLYRPRTSIYKGRNLQDGGTDFVLNSLLSIWVRLDCLNLN